MNKYQQTRISCFISAGLPGDYGDYPCNHSKRDLLITGVLIVFIDITGSGNFKISIHRSITLILTQNYI